MLHSIYHPFFSLYLYTIHSLFLQFFFILEREREHELREKQRKGSREGAGAEDEEERKRESSHSLIHSPKARSSAQTAETQFLQLLSAAFQCTH